jgi:hypothetical protein
MLHPPSNSDYLFGLHILLVYVLKSAKLVVLRARVKPIGPTAVSCVETGHKNQCLVENLRVSILVLILFIPGDWDVVHPTTYDVE